MNLHINDKFSLSDLVTKGSAARRYVKPNVLISDAKDSVFAEGDIIDANAVYRLIKDLSVNDLGDEAKEYIQGLVAQSQEELTDEVYTLQQQVEDLKKNPVGPKHIILTQQQYDSLDHYEKDAIYFIVENLNNRWTFGDKFPIMFGSGWSFGDTFPIQL